jgi:hypothetical protein
MSWSNFLLNFSEIIYALGHQLIVIPNESRVFATFVTFSLIRGESLGPVTPAGAAATTLP